jgi:1-acyl-sn-glycerol-3-phosphate acyltransferase
MLLPLQAGSPSWDHPTLAEVLRRPIRERDIIDRLLIRGLALLARPRVRIVSGLEHIEPANDPFILVLNHTTRREALLVPAVLMLHRGGSRVHFMADWNFRLIPGIGLIYRRAQALTITRKSARPPLLNLLRPLYTQPPGPLANARARLAIGRSIGIFPEARVNRDPLHLLRGRLGAAWLSLETSVAIVPAGISLCSKSVGGTPPQSVLNVRIGAPLHPPRPTRSPPSIADLRTWHAVVMTEIGRLSGKEWTHAAGEEACTTMPASARAA